MKHNGVRRGRPRAFATPERIDMAQAIVAHAYGVTVEDIRRPGRACVRACHARQVAMYLSHVVFSQSLTEVGRAFGRDRSTASYACNRIEDLRDDPDVERTLVWMETVLRQATGLQP
ncbi:MAG TPA: helix-turn-helix domain-containing protein [Rhizomicrobium sp.]|jgi:chromosomal replication initiation ATPase DnaA|nr:helix-turn-helix domain-containing protein [Rhizomicrobium sp.]